MRFINGLLVVMVMAFFLPVAVLAQQDSNPFNVFADLSNPDVNSTKYPGHGLTPVNHQWIAQASQPVNEQVDPTEKNLIEIQKQLEQRNKALAAEWEALKKEKEALEKISRGGTLRGSKRKKYIKRTTAFNDRVEKYNEDKEKLRQDIEDYNEAVKANKAVVQETSKTPAEADSDENQAQINETKAYLEKKRKELLKEHRILHEEKQLIGRQEQKNSLKGNAPTVNAQLSRWHEKMKEFVKKKDAFNNAVRTFNETTGQDIQPLPNP